MKLTWFAASCFRLHIGGQIIVTDPDDAPDGVARAELVSGADLVVTLGDSHLAPFDADSFRPRRARRPIDDDLADANGLFRFGESGLFVEPSDEPHLILCGPQAKWGRFADGAVVILCGAFDALVDAVAELSRTARPRLVILAPSAFEATDLAALAAAADGTPVQILEPLFALEV